MKKGDVYFARWTNEFRNLVKGEEITITGKEYFRNGEDYVNTSKGPLPSIFLTSKK